ncbi:ribonuclease H-like domain-containing protein [Tanacetum coccineum]
MISMRLKKFYKKTGRKLHFDTKEPFGFDKTKVECYNCHKTGHFARECRSKGNTGYKSKDNGRRPGKQEEPKALVTLDGEGVDWTEKSTLKLLAEAVKEKEELKTKLENFQSSSKGLSKLLNSQMSKRDKSGLGYGDQVHDGVLSYENEVFQSVFDSRSSDVGDSPVHDRFANVEGMHAVPPPMTGNYMPSGPDRGKTLEYVPKPVVVKPNVVSQPKVWPDAPIIDEYESDSDDEYVIQPLKEQERPSFAFINTVKHVKTPRETVKEQNTYSPSPKANKRDWNGLMSKRLGLGYEFTKKACLIEQKKGKGTGQGENRLVWNNVKRLNHQNQFVPTAVLTRTG